jgi:hypothetical protein
MFAPILEFVPLMEKKDEFIRVVKKEVLPILSRTYAKTYFGLAPVNPETPRAKPTLDRPSSTPGSTSSDAFAWTFQGLRKSYI